MTIKKRLLLFFIYLSIIIIPLLISIAFCYSINLPSGAPKVEYKNPIDIFIHNISIGLVLVLLTDLITIPIIIFNSFYLGIILGSIIQSTNLEYILSSTAHLPLELTGWLLIIYLSRDFRDSLIQLIKKKHSNFKIVFKKIIIYLIPLYLIAALIEGFEIHLILKG